MNLRKFISSLLAVLCLANPLATFADEAKPAPASFSDVLRTHNNYVAITYLAESSVFSGYSDGTFRPDDPINRAEALKVIFKAFGIEAPEFSEPVPFADVKPEDWFARFVMKAKSMGVVQGNDSDGTFAPERQVNKAEFLKILLMANDIKPAPVERDAEKAKDVAGDEWFASYMNYAFQIGLIAKNSQGMLEPAKPLSRGEAASIIYLLTLIKNSKDTQFLLHRAEAELAQIEVYIAANKIARAKTAAELAVDLTQQSLKNMPESNVVLGAAKLARAYDWLVDAFMYGIEKNFTSAAEWANNAIDKANEAWEANNATQPIARHIKDRAREILSQVGGVEE